jgi:hypothetical protein
MLYAIIYQYDLLAVCPVGPAIFMPCVPYHACMKIDLAIPYVPIDNLYVSICHAAICYVALNICVYCLVMLLQFAGDPAGLPSKDTNGSLSVCACCKSYVPYVVMAYATQ